MQPEAVTNMVVVEDDHNDEDGGDDDIVLHARTRQPYSMEQTDHQRVPINHPNSRMPLHDLPTPTLSPSRRELTPFTMQEKGQFCYSPASYAGSTATTATMQSEEEDVNFLADEDIRSTATTEIVSHRQRQLLASTLAAAEKQLQILHQEQRQRQLSHDVDDDNEIIQQFMRLSRRSQR